MNVKKRFGTFILHSWKQLLFEGFATSDTHFRNCADCVQTLLFLWCADSPVVRGNERQKNVWNLPFTLLKAVAFGRFWHIWHTISKLQKLCSDITLSLKCGQSCSSRKWTSKNGLEPSFYTPENSCFLWVLTHLKHIFEIAEIVFRHYSFFEVRAVN